MSVRDLPTFPWDTLREAEQQARAYVGTGADGQPDTSLVNLSVGTPVDETPQTIRDALRESANAPGYPQTAGTQDLREAISAWFARTRGVPRLDPAAVLPTIGSKELVAWLPTLLGLGVGDVVGLPRIAYPTYDVGARLAGATPVRVDGLAALGPTTASTTPKLLWINSPSNPTGAVLGVEHLRKVVTWARSRGAIVASDECYAQLDWRDVSEQESFGSTPSILDPRVNGGDNTGLLCVYSTSKQSNLAGYRAAFVAGDRELVGRLLAVRKHAGMIMPWPVQQALLAAVTDDSHVVTQRARYANRRRILAPAVEEFGLRIEYSQAGLYLWASADEPGRISVDRLAARGILVAPGEFYGPAGARHVRIALTATDERIAVAAHRLRATASDDAYPALNQRL